MLQKNEIRLLILEPSLSEKAQIRCVQKKVSLDDDPTYEALSYAWGDPTPVNDILLDGRSFKVTLSAWDALKALRHKISPRVLWIDAICINQTDLAERSEQVKLMGAIYKKASSVRVWLGPDDDGDKDAIPILKTMLSVTGAKDITLGLDTGSRDRISQLQRFFARSWWERLWVVQEVALGQKVAL